MPAGTCCWELHPSCTAEAPAPEPLHRLEGALERKKGCYILSPGPNLPLHQAKTQYYSPKLLLQLLPQMWLRQVGQSKLFLRTQPACPGSGETGCKDVINATDSCELKPATF